MHNKMSGLLKRMVLSSARTSPCYWRRIWRRGRSPRSLFLLIGIFQYDLAFSLQKESTKLTVTSGEALTVLTRALLPSSAEEEVIISTSMKSLVGGVSYRLIKISFIDASRLDRHTLILLPTEGDELAAFPDFGV
jgi:hypothetical protein